MSIAFWELRSEVLLRGCQNLSLLLFHGGMHNITNQNLGRTKEALVGESEKFQCQSSFPAFYQSEEKGNSQKQRYNVNQFLASQMVLS